MFHSKYVPDYALMAGVPARQIGWVCECEEILGDSKQCVKCGRTIILENRGDYVGKCKNNKSDEN